MRRLFGTDGIRGTVDAELTAELVAGVGSAIASALRDGVMGEAVDRPSVVVARDTRPSGLRLEEAITAGLNRRGADVLLGGVLPTAAVAYLTRSLPADAGVVISASHNPPQDNGVKVFGPGGWKLSTDAEEEIERRIDGAAAAATGEGATERLHDALDRYVGHLVERARTSGLRVVVDCANGAAYRAGPEALQRLGVDVEAMNTDSDGSHINDACGALHPDAVAARARERKAIGITFDGDADRVLLSDEKGNIVDGDAILAILARRMRETERLRGDAVVATVMANQAFRRWCADEAIELVETSVGDRYVLEMMRARGVVLGGEQSGHVIIGDRTTTGDGILTAIEVLAAVAERGGRLADIVPFHPLPQVLVNVRTNGRRVNDGDHLRAAVTDAQAKLGDDGRILVRRSGTEPVVRVMVEASDRALATELADSVAAAIAREASEA